jgi:hypothetical protein
MSLMLGQSQNAGYVIVISGFLFLGEVSNDVAAGGVALGLKAAFEFERRPEKQNANHNIVEKGRDVVVKSLAIECDWMKLYIFIRATY